ncbi:hypothetical protein B296_00006778 [Ensete ventricosum]|uniref:Uncharacterized protein n=1 Tax=Ensete ventricosum TaxID=4639 RepID=A0A427B5H9_ENSVE|nr:hypothetical protein B296_00006778 [Ensete ventricosum]
MWHEARRSERKVHDLMDAARKRAQRRAVYLAKRRGDPQQSLQVAGSRCRVYRDDGLYQAAQDQQGFMSCKHLWGTSVCNGPLSFVCNLSELVMSMNVIGIWLMKCLLEQLLVDPVRIASSGSFSRL